MLELTDVNFVAYAKHHYRNQYCFSEEEFNNDLKKIRYIKILINRYRDTKVLQERLLLNHFITMGNVFAIEGLVRMLFYKVEEENYPILKTYLKFLNFMPNVVYNISGHNLWDSEIQEIKSITESLNKL